MYQNSSRDIFNSMQSMRREKRLWLFLMIGTISFICLLLLVIYIPPSVTYMLGSISVSVVLIFFLFLFLSLSSFFSLLFRTIHHGVLTSLFFVLSLAFLFFNLREPLFFILLAALCMIIELLLYKKPSRMGTTTHSKKN